LSFLSDERAEALLALLIITRIRKGEIELLFFNRTNAEAPITAES